MKISNYREDIAKIEKENKPKKRTSKYMRRKLAKEIGVDLRTINKSRNELNSAYDRLHKSGFRISKKYKKGDRIKMPDGSIRTILDCGTTKEWMNKQNNCKQNTSRRKVGGNNE